MCCLEEGSALSAHQSISIPLGFKQISEGSRNLEESYPLLYISEKHKELVHPRNQVKSKARRRWVCELKIGLSLHQFSKLSGFRRTFCKEICSFKQSSPKILKLAFVGSREDGEIF